MLYYNLFLEYLKFYGFLLEFTKLIHVKLPFWLKKTQKIQEIQDCEIICINLNFVDFRGSDFLVLQIQGTKNPENSVKEQARAYMHSKEKGNYFFRKNKIARNAMQSASDAKTLPEL